MQLYPCFVANIYVLSKSLTVEFFENLFHLKITMYTLKQYGSKLYCICMFECIAIYCNIAICDWILVKDISYGNIGFYSKEKVRN